MCKLGASTIKSNMSLSTPPDVSDTAMHKAWNCTFWNGDYIMLTASRWEAYITCAGCAHSVLARLSARPGPVTGISETELHVHRASGLTNRFCQALPRTLAPEAAPTQPTRTPWSAARFGRRWLLAMTCM